jgi:sirohydrochlorin cobaltochelatase
VLPDHWPDATLVLVGHGSTRNADSAAPVFQHAAELRRRRLFAAVREAFWKQAPRLDDVLAEVHTANVFIAPLFMSEGFFSEDVIPRALGFQLTSDPLSRVLDRGTQRWHYCRPAGTHDGMTAVLLGRARDVVAQFPFPRAPGPAETTLLIAGHGTEQNDQSRESIERQVQLLRDRGEYAGVHAIYIEESPRIPECYALAQSRNIVIVPFFVSDGMHTREDIPVLLGEPERVVRERLAAGAPTWRNPTERQGKLVWYAPAVGTDPRVAEVILGRVREAWTQTSSLK